MANSPLGDRDVHPDDKVLARVLGKAFTHWKAFTERLAADFPSNSIEWRYYNDGKSWLCKLTRGKKTVSWISARAGFFTVSSYFMERNDDAIRALDVDRGVKDRYFALPWAGKLKPLTIEVKSKKSVDDAFALIGFKSGQG